MPIDPRIALSIRSPDIPSSLDAYARFAQIQGMQQEQQMNALRMQEAQRETEERNALRQLNPSSPDYESQLQRINPQLAFSHRQQQLKEKTAEATRSKADIELKAARRKFIDDARRNLSSNPSDENIKAWAQDSVVENLFSQQEAESQAAQLLALSPAERTRVLASSGASAAELMPKPPAKTELARLFEEQRNYPPGSPQFNAYQRAINKQSTHAPAVKVNVGGTMLEREEQKEKGKFNVESYKNISNLAQTAVRILPSLETQERILDQGFRTGFGTDAQKAAASVLSALGVPEAATFAANAESFGAAANQAVLSKQLEQKGPQTEADARRIEGTGARLSNTPEGNKFIISVAKAQLRRDLEQRNFYDKWWRENKTYEGAEDAWYAGEGAKSLFDRPELSRYVKSNVPAKKAEAIPPVPAGVDAKIWNAMTPEERSLWK